MPSSSRVLVHQIGFASALKKTVLQAKKKLCCSKKAKKKKGAVTGNLEKTNKICFCIFIIILYIRYH